MSSRNGKPLKPDDNGESSKKLERLSKKRSKKDGSEISKKQRMRDNVEVEESSESSEESVQEATTSRMGEVVYKRVEKGSSDGSDPESKELKTVEESSLQQGDRSRKRSIIEECEIDKRQEIEEEEYSEIEVFAAESGEKSGQAMESGYRRAEELGEGSSQLGGNAGIVAIDTERGEEKDNNSKNIEESTLKIEDESSLQTTSSKSEDYEATTSESETRREYQTSTEESSTGDSDSGLTPETNSSTIEGSSMQTLSSQTGSNDIESLGGIVVVPDEENSQLTTSTQAEDIEDPLLIAAAVGIEETVSSDEGTSKQTAETLDIFKSLGSSIENLEEITSEIVEPTTSSHREGNQVPNIFLLRESSEGGFETREICSTAANNQGDEFVVIDVNLGFSDTVSSVDESSKQTKETVDTSRTLDSSIDQIEISSGVDEGNNQTTSRFVQKESSQSGIDEISPVGDEAECLEEQTQEIQKLVYTKSSETGSKNIKDSSSAVDEGTSQKTTSSQGDDNHETKKLVQRESSESGPENVEEISDEGNCQATTSAQRSESSEFSQSDIEEHSSAVDEPNVQQIINIQGEDDQETQKLLQREFSESGSQNLEEITDEEICQPSAQGSKPSEFNQSDIEEHSSAVDEPNVQQIINIQEGDDQETQKLLQREFSESGSQNLEEITDEGICQPSAQGAKRSEFSQSSIEKHSSVLDEANIQQITNIQGGDYQGTQRLIETDSNESDSGNLCKENQVKVARKTL